MDNYFLECPPMMDDMGRSVGTDYRSSQVREEIFRQENCVFTENDSRTLRIENGEWIMDYEWDVLRATRSCFPTKTCFHKNSTTRVTSDYNNAEILAYNGIFQRQVVRQIVTIIERQSLPEVEREENLAKPVLRKMLTLDTLLKDVRSDAKRPIVSDPKDFEEVINKIYCYFMIL